VNPDDTISRFVGCLLGIAAGDSLGLPYEGLSAGRGARLFPDRDRQHLVFARGMVSDDTEHACFTAQALIKAGDDPDRFAKHLAWHLRFWLMGLPAGVGLATGRAIVKLWLGFPPHRSGVFSAGNGPAMRSPLIGLKYGHDFDKLRRIVLASTKLTHTDPKAYQGAVAIALASYMNAHSTATVDPEAYLLQLNEVLIKEQADEFLDLVQRAKQSAAKGESVAHFAEQIGSKRGISGY